uniref:GPI ethanolamine phosphate transferase 3-like n=1 Tax=Styela clava TaxID=7725 RepID=UPI00193A0403|nr:GPI ethanolamine phosphate transferase 3-like [Styela clava]
MNSLFLNCLILSISLALFTRGFLLMRLEIDRKTPSCQSDFPSIEDDISSCQNSHFKFKKLVVMIIDALRYDFASFDEDRAMQMIFHNKMPIFNDLMKKEGCENARLWRFWADAPTTTMQRIKGLTTGSLPTFIDLSKNFASSEITEDNILDQFIASGKNITFMGDDTWMNLFPGRFNKAFPYPSFDVKDLHLVDNGVIKHLLPELGNNDWQLLIAHFLGVDHCGHRYGPFHPEMPLKLQQMNGIVQGVAESIDNETLLLVMGDHGMTHTGDHGGETFNEVNAALFAYNRANKFQRCKSDESKDPLVNQVDIVPTISFLLGTAIPFANLGVAISDMMPEQSYNEQEHDSIKHLKTSDVLFSNAKQVYTYINSYQDISKSLPAATYQNLTKVYKELEKLFKEQNENSDTLQQQLVEFIKSARQMCREVWAKFDIFSMIIGLTLSVILIAISLHSIDPIFGLVYQMVFKTLLVLMGVSIFISIIIKSNLFLAFSLLLSGVMFVTTCIIGLKYVWEAIGRMKILDEIFPTILLIMYSVSFTTNSFILNEDITTLYLVLSLIICITASVFYGKSSSSNSNIAENSNNSHSANESNSEINKFPSKLVHRRRQAKNHSQDKSAHEKTPLLQQNHILLLLISLAALLSSRLALYFRYCRAEQFWCFNDESTEDNQSSTGYNIPRVLLSCFSLIASVWILLWHLRKGGNLKNTAAMNGFVCRKNFPMATGFVILSWILLLVPPKGLAVLPSWCVTYSPCIVYLLLAIFFIFHWVNPVYTTILYPDGFGNYVESHIKTTITQIYNELKSKLNKNNKESVDNSAPVVFGLYTVITASTVSVLLCLIILFSMLLGPEKATSLSLWLICSVCALEMNSISMQQRGSSYVPWSSVILWGMISSFWWFATGHQASISSIQWDAAFVGFQGSHATNIIPGLLVLLNTFCMQILSTVSLPLLMLWPQTKSRWYFNNEEQNEEEFTSELFFYKDQERFFNVFKDLLSKYFGFYIAKIVGCMVCTCLHRRHLMVWWIFAPRYMFEGVSLIIVMLSSIFTYAHMHNTGNKLAKWFRSVEETLE